MNYKNFLGFKINSELPTLKGIDYNLEERGITYILY